MSAEDRWEDAAYDAAYERFGDSWDATREFETGARWQREALRSDGTILRALNAEEPRAATDNLEDWGDQSIARMRRVLTAVLGEDQTDE